MSTIINGFTNQPNVIVEWCHSSMPKCYQIPPPTDDTGPEPPQIGGDAGYLTIQAFEKQGSQLIPIESSVAIGPFLPNDHKIILSYEISEYKWTIRAKLKGKETFKRNDVRKMQVDVNVEIGPKNP